jgi:hypothetical protein
MANITSIVTITTFLLIMLMMPMPEMNRGKVKMSPTVVITTRGKEGYADKNRKQ